MQGGTLSSLLQISPWTWELLQDRSFPRGICDLSLHPLRQDDCCVETPDTLSWTVELHRSTLSLWLLSLAVCGPTSFLQSIKIKYHSHWGKQTSDLVLAGRCRIWHAFGFTRPVPTSRHKASKRHTSSPTLKTATTDTWTLENKEHASDPRKHNLKY